jgi:hypothetical protein
MEQDTAQGEIGRPKAIAVRFVRREDEMKTSEELNKHTAALQESVNELMQKHSGLQSFRDARDWDEDAKAVLDLLQQFRNDLSGYREEQAEALDKLQQERSQGSLFKKAFSSRSSENDVKDNIKGTDEAIKSIHDVTDKLSEMMDKTPASKSEQKEIADDLRQLKKDLALQKREINESLRAVRANARQKTAGWTGVHSGLLGSAARYQRATIRLDKERSLVPHENQKAFIENRLIALEKDLNWVLHFRADASGTASQDPQTDIGPEQIQRCSYCGRRVFSHDVCPGCGAAI